MVAMASTVWKGRITFGMVSIPVRMYKAARRERIRFHHVVRSAEPPPVEADEPEAWSEPEEPVIQPDAEESAAPAAAAPVERVRFTPVSSAAGAAAAPLERPQLLKGYEIEKDQYVVLEPKEVAALRPRTSTELTIGEFVKLDEIDPVYFDVSYYLAPDRGAEKPYAVHFSALNQSGYAAIGTLAMHGREHAAVIRPGKYGLILHTLFYLKEVRSTEEFRADPELVGAKELNLATQFVTMLAEKFDPSKLQDSFEERLRQLIESRTAVAGADAPETTSHPKAPVVDIAEALRKSLEMVRKPAKSETVKPAAAKRKKRSG
jgi:DNA end-binding protein Ku